MILHFATRCVTDLLAGDVLPIPRILPRRDCVDNNLAIAPSPAGAYTARSIFSGFAASGDLGKEAEHGVVTTLGGGVGGWGRGQRPLPRVWQRTIWPSGLASAGRVAVAAGQPARCPERWHRCGRR